MAPATPHEEEEQDEKQQSIDKFLQDSRKFLKLFDSEAEDLFQGAKLEQLSVEFVEKYAKLLSEYNQFPLSSINFNHDQQVDWIKDDFRLLNVALSDDEDDDNPSKQNNKLFQTIAQIYCRCSKATYLRVTFNKSRLNQEDNRQVPVDWARKALRFNVNNDFEVAYWFMITIGWQLDNMPASKDRIHMSQVFKLSTLLCIKWRPEDPLAHHLLGRYYYEVGRLTWLERTIIKTLLLQHHQGKAFKIEGTHAEAEQKFRHAHELKPTGWPPTGLWMARTLQAQKRPVHEIRTWCKMGLSYDCREPTTEIERREMLELLAKLDDDDDGNESNVVGGKQ